MSETRVYQAGTEPRPLDHHEEFNEALGGVVGAIARLSEGLSQDSLAALQSVQNSQAVNSLAENWPLTSVGENSHEFTDRVVSRLMDIHATSVPSPMCVKSFPDSLLSNHYPEPTMASFVGELVGWADAMAESGWFLQLRVALNNTTGTTVSVYPDDETIREYLLARSISERLTAQNGGTTSTSLQVSPRVIVNGSSYIVDDLRLRVDDGAPEPEPDNESEPVLPPPVVNKFLATFTASEHADGREQTSLLHDLPEQAWEVLEAYEEMSEATDELNQLARQAAANTYVHDVVKHRGSVDKQLLKKAGVDLDVTLQAFVDATIDSFAANGQRSRQEIAASLAGKYKTFADLQILPNLWDDLVVTPIKELRAKL